MKYVVWGLIVLLLIVHQDFWFWENTTLIFGFMPITLMFHAGISLLAGFTWFLAITYCWPKGLSEETGSEKDGGSAA